MYTLDKFANDGSVSYFVLKMTVLCYRLEYSYIVQIAKGRTSPVFAFNMQTQEKEECLVVFCML